MGRTRIHIKLYTRERGDATMERTRKLKGDHPTLWQCRHREMGLHLYGARRGDRMAGVCISGSSKDDNTIVKCE